MGMDRPPYPCPNEGTLVALLHHCGIDSWSIQQANTELQKGRMAVLPIVCSQAQMQAYFPLHRPRTHGRDAEHHVGVGILRHQEAAALVGHAAVVRKPPIGVADGVPVIEVLAVKQRDPPSSGLTGRWAQVPGHGACHKKQP
jgi:hypothetical protein